MAWALVVLLIGLIEKLAKGEYDEAVYIVNAKSA